MMTNSETMASLEKLAHTDSTVYQWIKYAYQIKNAKKTAIDTQELMLKIITSLIDEKATFRQSLINHLSTTVTPIKVPNDK